MDKSERIFHLHNMIKQGNAPTRDELMEATQASKSSFRRDIDHLRTFFGAPVIYCAKRNGYIYDANEHDFEMPGLWMNPGELHALLTCVQLLENLQPGLLTPELGPLMTRLRQMLSSSGHNYETIARKISLPTSNARHPDPNRFSIVAEATLREHQLLIQYAPRTRNTNNKDSEDRQVDPLRLVHYKDNWLLIAWCHRRKDLRTFAIDRIRTPRIGEAIQLPINDESLNLYTNASFGIFSGAASNWAVLVFEAEPARWVQDEIWHPEQVGQILSNGAYELRIPYSDSRELQMEILKYGAGVEVVAPPTLREAVTLELQKSLARYASKSTL